MNEKKDTLTEGVGQLSMGGQQLLREPDSWKRVSGIIRQERSGCSEGIGMLQEQLASAEGQMAQLGEAVNQLTEGAGALVRTRSD